MGLPAEVLEEKPQGRGAEIPLLVKLKARNLYLVDGLSWPEIGVQCGWDAKSLAQMASREKWTQEKQRRKALLLAKADARMSATSNEVIEAIASKSEEAALKAMKNVDAALDRSDEFAAKDFQAYTAGVKNLASVARLMRDPASSDAKGEVNLTVFMLRAGDVKTEPKQVTELAPASPK